MGLNLSHVDDFTIGGDVEFVRRIVKGIQEQFTVSKVEEDKFRFRIGCKGRKWKNRRINGGLCKFSRRYKGDKEGR